MNPKEVKVNVNEIRKTLLRSIDLLISFRNNLNKKNTEVIELRSEIERLSGIIDQVNVKESEYTNTITDLESTLNKVNKEKIEYEKTRKRGTLLINLLDNDMKLAEYKKKIDQAKEEGIRLAKKQKELENDEEKKEMYILIKRYRKDLEECKKTIDELLVQKEELEKYNKKANEEIMILIQTLKTEELKQKQLSSDLVTLTSELRSHRMNNSDNYC